MPRGGAQGGARAAAALAQKVAKTPKSSKTLDDHAFLHDHAHHEPHFPEGVEPGMWKQEVRKFQADGLQMVSDPNVVGAWSEVDVAAWIACISTNKFEHYSDKFLQHHISGAVLLNLKEHHLEELGIERLSDQIKLWEIIAQMQRRCKKPETSKLKVPAWPSCAWQQFSFSWANTSEGKDGSDMVRAWGHVSVSSHLHTDTLKCHIACNMRVRVRAHTHKCTHWCTYVKQIEEVAGANGNIALVSTLVWGMAWDLFFGSATVCYCPTDTNGVWKIPEIDYCFCSTAWDMDKWPLALFYAFAGLSAIMFMMSTIFAVVQILMVYEMSDEAEVEVFLCEYCRGCRGTHTHA